MKLTQSGCVILSQLNSLIEQLKKEEYYMPMEVLFNNSIGKHVRHIIEFFEVMLESLESSYLNYDDRSHNQLLETNPAFAIQTISELKEKIIQIDTDIPLKMGSCYASYLGGDAIIHTSLQREMLYTIEHSVHHMAIIKIAVNHLGRKVFLPENFGVAQSTINYQKR